MDVYQMVTERIIERLEKGYIPWKKPWANCLDGTFIGGRDNKCIYFAQPWN